MPKIFISYRRKDSAPFVGRIYERLAREFGEKNIFYDIEDIPKGKNFKDILRQNVASCDVLLAIIGPQWSSIKDANGNKRLFNDDDYVRYEVDTALRIPTVTVIPVLIGDTYMPSKAELPSVLKDLPDLNAAKVRNDPDFHRDLDELILVLRDSSNALETSSASKPATKKGCLNFNVVSLIIAIITLLVAIITIFSEEWRNDLLYKLHLFTATPPLATESFVVATSTFIQTVNETPESTSPTIAIITAQPATISSVPSSQPPIVTGSKSVELELLITETSLTIYVPEGVSLNGLCLMGLGREKCTNVVETISSLQATQGMGKSGYCYIYVEENANPSSDLRCNKVIWIPIPKPSVFWYDAEKRQILPVLVYLYDRLIVDSCDDPSGECVVNWQ